MAVLLTMLACLGDAGEADDQPILAQAWLAWRMTSNEQPADVTWLKERVALGFASDDVDRRRLGRVAIDALIKLAQPGDPAVLNSAWNGGAHVEALALAASSGSVGAGWALDVALGLPQKINRPDAALLAMAATGDDLARVGQLWPDIVPSLRIIVVSPTEAGGPLGMFGSRSGGGRKKRHEVASWPPEFRYELCTPQDDGAVALPSPTGNPYHYRRRSIDVTRHGPSDGFDGHPIRVSLVLARAMKITGRWTYDPDIVAVKHLPWTVGGDLARDVTAALGQEEVHWRSAIELIRASGLRAGLDVTPVKLVALVDSRQDASVPLPEIPGGPPWKRVEPQPTTESELERQIWSAERERMERLLEPANP